MSVENNPTHERVTAQMLVDGYVPAPEAAVTPEMIAAGADLLANEWGLCAPGDGASDLAEMIFRVMLEHAPYREACSRGRSSSARGA